VKKIKIAVEKNKKSQKAPYKTTTQNGASLLEAIVGRRQWCFVFWDSFGNRETPNLSEGPLYTTAAAAVFLWRVFSDTPACPA
jgi:hypothetical protein